MSGQELIDWLVKECEFRRIPPTDSAMVLLLRELPDIETWTSTLKRSRRVAREV